MSLPEIKNIDHIFFPPPVSVQLSNGIPLHIFSGAPNDILRIDLVFDCGRWTEKAPLIADATAVLFKSGTTALSSFQLNEKIDFFGTTIKAGAGYNTLTVSLYCMNRFLEPSLELLLTCLQSIIFPEQEVSVYQKNSLAKLRLSKEKNDYLADTAFRKTLFGDTHPYGYETTETAIQHITTEKLFGYYSTQLRTDNLIIYMAGKADAAAIKLVEKYLGNWNPGREKTEAVTYTFSSSAEKNIRIPKEKSVQASVAIGKILFNKQHKDYAPFTLLNTIFGGYFSSRLMSNIREEKGLTYGIHSGLSPLKYSGSWAIYTDTNNKTLEICLREIYLELERLQNEPIPAEEIKLARNYILGKYLSRTDGPFNRMETFKSYLIEGISIATFQQYVEEIKAADAVSLQRLAQLYLSKDSMYEVIAG